jgi:hypothetical protein
MGPHVSLTPSITPPTPSLLPPLLPPGAHPSLFSSAAHRSEADARAGGGGTTRQIRPLAGVEVPAEEPKPTARRRAPTSSSSGPPSPSPLPCVGGAARARAPGRRRRSSCTRRRPAGGSSSPAPCPPAVNQARPLLRRWIRPLLHRARSAPTHRRSRGGRPPGQRRNHTELISFLPTVGGESSFVGGSSLPAAPPQWLMSADRAPWIPPSGLPLPDSGEVQGREAELGGRPPLLRLDGAPRPLSTWRRDGAPDGSRRWRDACSSCGPTTAVLPCSRRRRRQSAKREVVGARDRGACGGPGGGWRSLLDPPEYEGDRGRRLFGVLLQDARCGAKNGILLLEEMDPVPSAGGLITLSTNSHGTPPPRPSVDCRPPLAPALPIFQPPPPPAGSICRCGM